MDPTKKQRLQRIIEEGYEFRFGEYVEAGFQIWKKNIAGFTGYAAVTLILIGFMGFIPIIGQLASLLLSPPLLVGFYIVAHRLHRGEAAEFREFFQGFDFFGPLVLINLVWTFFSLLLLMPMIYPLISNMGALFDPTETPVLIPEAVPNWTFLLLLPWLYLAIAWHWASQLVVFHGLGFWDAMETSRQIIQRQWFFVFLFFIVLGILSVLGYFALLIGVFFTYPMALCMDYAAFADVTRLMEGEADESDIVEHLVE